MSTVAPRRPEVHLPHSPAHKHAPRDHDAQPDAVDPKNAVDPKDTMDPTVQPAHAEAKHDEPKHGETKTSSRFDVPFNWPVMGWIGMLHVIAIVAAPFVFTWQAVVLAIVLHWITGGIGICLGFHRMLTHSSFKTYRPVRYALAVIGGLAGEGGAVDWVAAHRQHHANSDQDDDPHSPKDGGWWSHVFWLGRSVYGKSCTEYAMRWAPDLAKDPVMRFIDRFAIPSHFVFGGLLWLLGYSLGGAYMGWSFGIWGMFVRLCVVLHSTWFVNSASHMWGYKNYETSDDSRNNWWVALVSYGEGWHNNHHAYPRMANHGHKWWEIDMTFRMIRLMQWCGIAWDVVDYKQKTLASDA